RQGSIQNTFELRSIHTANVKNLILLNKKEGETPLQALDKFRAKYKTYKDSKMTYAGRLDPMASGLLLILAGDQTKNKGKYLDMDKEYDFRALFGFATDTCDVLGKVINNYELSITNYELKKQIKNNLKSFLGETTQRYPIYSSKTVKGKPLFMYARAGEDVDIPKRKIVIKKLKLEKVEEMSNIKLFKDIEKRIKKVQGDFRQDEILKIWKEKLLSPQTMEEKSFIVSFKTKCSSGTYVRVIANSLGIILGIPALAFSIKRTKIGKYVI
ncbi:MAG: hypothetical protein WCP17_03455, partial [bacterium]